MYNFWVEALGVIALFNDLLLAPLTRPRSWVPGTHGTGNRSTELLLTPNQHDNMSKELVYVAVSHRNFLFVTVFDLLNCYWLLVITASSGERWSYLNMVCINRVFLKKSGEAMPRSLASVTPNSFFRVDHITKNDKGQFNILVFCGSDPDFSLINLFIHNTNCFRPRGPIVTCNPQFVGCSKS